MRGILSLGAIGLMTGATAMITVPTDARAVTPIDLISQTTADFPESVEGIPAVPESDPVETSEPGVDTGTAEGAGAEEVGSTASAETDSVTTRVSLAESLMQSLLPENNTGSVQDEQAVAEGNETFAGSSGETVAEGESETVAGAEDGAAAQSADAAADTGTAETNPVTTRQSLAESLRQSLLSENNTNSAQEEETVTDGNDTSTESSGETAAAGESATAEDFGGAEEGPAAQTDPAADTGTAESNPVTTRQSLAESLRQSLLTENNTNSVQEEETGPDGNDTSTESSGETVSSGETTTAGESATGEDFGGAEEGPAAQTDPAADTGAAETNPVTTRESLAESLRQSLLAENNTNSVQQEDAGPEANESSAESSGETVSSAETAAGGGSETGDALAGSGDASTAQTGGATADSGSRSSRTSIFDMIQARLGDLMSGEDETSTESAGEQNSETGAESAANSSGSEETSAQGTAESNPENTGTAQASEGEATEALNESPAEAETAADTGNTSGNQSRVNMNEMVRSRLSALAAETNEASGTEADDGSSENQAQNFLNGTNSTMGSLPRQTASGNDPANDESSQEAATADSANTDGGEDAATGGESGAGADSGSTTVDAGDAESSQPVNTREAMAARLRRVAMGADDSKSADATANEEMVDDESVMRARRVVTAEDEVVDARPREVSAVDEMVGVRTRAVPDGVDEVMDPAAHEVDERTVSPKPAPTPVSGDAKAVSAIPEPSTWIMMIFGFWLAAWRLRRRRQEGVRAVPA